MWKTSLSRTISLHPHLHLPDQSCIFKFLISFFKESMPRLCTPTWLHLNFCFSIVFVGACMLFCDVYIPHHHLPFLLLLLLLPSPVLSVPTISKGRVSTTSLQRSRSDVDVNAAAVAKHRYVGQSRAAGHLPPGSCSSLGKGTAWWNEWIMRRRHQSVWYQQFFGSDGLVFVKFLTFREDFCETPHTYSEVSKDEATIHNWSSSVVGLAFLLTSTVSSFLLTSPSVYKTCQNVSMNISVNACFISEPHSPCWLVCFGVCCIYVILQKKCLVINTHNLPLLVTYLSSLLHLNFIFWLGLPLLVSFLQSSSMSIFPLFLPSPLFCLFATKDDSSDKIDGKIILLLLKAITILCFSVFSFLLFLHFYLGHLISSLKLHYVATAPPAVRSTL